MLANKKKTLKKKIVLQFDEVQHFVIKDLPFELISNKSIQFFQRFRISSDFLHKDPNLWKITTEYKEAKDIIATLKVVNDSAERGVKLMEEFNDKFTKQEEQKQYVLQVIFYFFFARGIIRNLLKCIIYYFRLFKIIGSNTRDSAVKF